MPIVRFALNDEYYKKLEKMAEKNGVSIQEFIRNKLFDSTTIYTPSEAVRRALARHKEDPTFITFCLPDLYEGEWNLSRGQAGAFGKQFFKYIEKKCSKITFDCMIDYGRRAQYKII